MPLLPGIFLHCVHQLLIYLLGDMRSVFLSAGWCTSSFAAPSVWNSLADHLHDTALGLNSFRRQLTTFLFAYY